MESRENDRMVAGLVAAGYADEKVAEAMRKVPRELFVPENLRESTYQDRPLPIGEGQTISAPGVVAFMANVLEVEKGMKVLDVGSGSGYVSAILSMLVGSEGKVVAMEVLPELVEQGKRNCRKLGRENIEFVQGDATQGYEREAPYDRITVGAAAEKVPESLVRQMKDGGKMVIPVNAGWGQDLLVVEKEEGKVKERKVMDVIFVPLKGKY